MGGPSTGRRILVDSKLRTIYFERERMMNQNRRVPIWLRKKFASSFKGERELSEQSGWQEAGGGNPEQERISYVSRKS